MKHVYWFAYYNPDSPSVRNRALFALQRLSLAHAIHYDLIYPSFQFGLVVRFLVIYARALFSGKQSTIVIQKVYTSGIYAKLLKLLVRFSRAHSCYDMDDAEYLRHRADTLRYFIRHSDTCLVASEALRNYCLQWNSNVVMTTSPVMDHAHMKDARNEVFTIGWVGGYNTNRMESAGFSHKKSLFRLVFPVLKRIDFPVHLVLLGVTLEEDENEIRHYFSEHKNISVSIPRSLDWRNEDLLYRMIASFDLGVSPMVNHPFNRAKSAFKVKQYLSCGIPVLASDVGENRNFVRHGQNGLLCQTTSDFEAGIRRFYCMPVDEYRNFSTSAKASLKAFDLNRYCSVVLKTITRCDVVTEEEEHVVETPPTHLTSPHYQGAWIAKQST